MRKNASLADRGERQSRWTVADTAPFHASARCVRLQTVA